MRKFGSKAQICQFELKFEYAEFNGPVHFFCVRPEKPFLGKFDPENQICQFILKFGTKTNSNKQNSMIMFTFCF